MITPDTLPAPSLIQLEPIDPLKEGLKAFCKYAGTAALAFGVVALGISVTDGAVAHWESISATDTAAVGGFLFGMGVCGVGFAGESLSEARARAQNELLKARETSVNIYI